MAEKNRLKNEKLFKLRFNFYDTFWVYFMKFWPIIASSFIIPVKNKKLFGQKKWAKLKNLSLHENISFL